MHIWYASMHILQVGLRLEIANLSPEDNRFWIKDKSPAPKVSFIWRFHCTCWYIGGDCMLMNVMSIGVMHHDAWPLYLAITDVFCLTVIHLWPNITSPIFIGSNCPGISGTVPDLKPLSLITEDLTPDLLFVLDAGHAGMYTDSALILAVTHTAQVIGFKCVLCAQLQTVKPHVARLLWLQHSGCKDVVGCWVSNHSISLAITQCTHSGVSY